MPPRTIGIHVVMAITTCLGTWEAMSRRDVRARPEERAAYDRHASHVGGRLLQVRHGGLHHSDRNRIRHVSELVAETGASDDDTGVSRQSVRLPANQGCRVGGAEQL